MDNEDAATLAILITVLIAAIRYWSEHVRRVPLEKLGLDAVNRVLRRESDSRRSAILARGWMTSHEWTEMNRRHLEAIESELKRRGFADERDTDQ